MEDVHYEDARAFTSVLRKARLRDSTVQFGSFLLKCRKVVDSKIQYNEAGIDMLNNAHEGIALFL